MVGGSYGAGNYAMCGRAYDPRFLFTWPNHRIAVMGEKQLSGVMDIIKREAALKTGQPIDEAKLELGRKMLEDQIPRESASSSPPARLWNNATTDPHHPPTAL